MPGTGFTPNSGMHDARRAPSYAYPLPLPGASPDLLIAARESRNSLPGIVSPEPDYTGRHSSMLMQDSRSPQLLPSWAILTPDARLAGSPVRASSSRRFSQSPDRHSTSPRICGTPTPRSDIRSPAQCSSIPDHVGQLELRSLHNKPPALLSAHGSIHAMPQVAIAFSYSPAPSDMADSQQPISVAGSAPLSTRSAFHPAASMPDQSDMQSSLPALEQRTQQQQQQQQEEVGTLPVSHALPVSQSSSAALQPTTTMATTTFSTTSHTSTTQQQQQPQQQPPHMPPVHMATTSPGVWPMPHPGMYVPGARGSMGGMIYPVQGMPVPMEFVAGVPMEYLGQHTVAGYMPSSWHPEYHPGAMSMVPLAVMNAPMLPGGVDHHAHQYSQRAPSTPTMTSHAPVPQHVPVPLATGHGQPLHQAAPSQRPQHIVQPVAQRPMEAMPGLIAKLQAVKAPNLHELAQLLWLNPFAAVPMPRAAEIRGFCADVAGANVVYKRRLKAFFQSVKAVSPQLQRAHLCSDDLATLDDIIANISTAGGLPDSAASLPAQIQEAIRAGGAHTAAGACLAIFAQHAPVPLRWRAPLEFADFAKRSATRHQDSLGFARRLYRAAVYLAPSAPQPWLEWGKAEDERGQLASFVRIMRWGTLCAPAGENLMCRALVMFEKAGSLAQARRATVSALLADTHSWRGSAHAAQVSNNTCWRVGLECVLMELRAGMPLDTAARALQELNTFAPNMGETVQAERLRLCAVRHDDHAQIAALAAEAHTMPESQPVWVAYIQLLGYVVQSQTYLLLQPGASPAAAEIARAHLAGYVSQLTTACAEHHSSISNQEVVHRHHLAAASVCATCTRNLRRWAAAAQRAGRHPAARAACVREHAQTLAKQALFNAQMSVQGQRASVVVRCADIAARVCAVVGKVGAHDGIAMAKELTTRLIRLAHGGNRHKCLRKAAQLAEMLGMHRSAQQLLLTSIRDSLSPAPGSKPVADDALPSGPPSVVRAWCAERLAACPGADGRAVWELAHFWARRGLPGPAAELLRAVSRHPEQAGRPMSMLASLATLCGMPAHGLLTILRQGLKMSPKSGDLWLELAKLHLNPALGVYDTHAAANALVRALCLTPQAGDIYVEWIRLDLLRAAGLGTEAFACHAVQAGEQPVLPLDAGRAAWEQFLLQHRSAASQWLCTLSPGYGIAWSWAQGEATPALHGVACGEFITARVAAGVAQHVDLYAAAAACAIQRQTLERASDVQAGAGLLRFSVLADYMLTMQCRESAELASAPHMCTSLTAAALATRVESSSCLLTAGPTVLPRACVQRLQGRALVSHQIAGQQCARGAGSELRLLAVPAYVPVLAAIAQQPDPAQAGWFLCGIPEVVARAWPVRASEVPAMDMWELGNVVFDYPPRIV